MPTDSQQPARSPQQAGSRAGGPEVQISEQLTAPEAAAVLDLVRRATTADGVSPLSEHALLQLRYEGERQARNVLLWYQGELAGYGHLDLADSEGAAGEMVIDPAVRQRGLGRRLGSALSAAAGDAGLRVWAHGELPAAARLAAASGFTRARALWQMRRPLTDPIPAPELAAGVAIRTFQAGQDEDAWVSVNRRAFADHPEQGKWTRTDLEMREQEPWFDPGGFFLAERDGRLVGFHWTKVHRGDPAAGDGAIGEVYVIGLDPAAQGTGLGRALTLIGLRYLRARGLPTVLLYVDETNTAAIRLYESLGFTRWRTDVMFAGPASRRG